MKINVNNKSVHRAAGEFVAGESFCWDGDCYIVTGGQQRGVLVPDGQVFVVNLANGRESYFQSSFVIEDPRVPEVVV